MHTFDITVSTHSRLKAAGYCSAVLKSSRLSFNTQPPEGGWSIERRRERGQCSFNTQPPEGGWACAACVAFVDRSFNTQPPEGGWVDVGDGVDGGVVSTHSRLKAAGSVYGYAACEWDVSTHSRLKAAGFDFVLD